MSKLSLIDSGVIRFGVTTFLVATLMIVGLIGCGTHTAKPEEVIAAIQSDGISFIPVPDKSPNSATESKDTIPASIIDLLAAHKVILIGESHQLREHFELMAQLIRQLHARGLRQVLIEWPHASNLVLQDYVASSARLDDWKPKRFLGGLMIETIKTLNSTAAVNEQIRIGAIDVNLDEYGGAKDFTAALGYLADELDNSSILKNFIKQYPNDAIGRTKAVKKLLADLADKRTIFITAWGQERYHTVIEMLEVEAVSINVRTYRNDRYDNSVKVREDEMKRLAELRIAEVNGLTLINVGGNHAQRRFLKGTRQEWLGDYLAHKSPAAAGQVYSVVVVPARGEPGTGGSIADYDILDASPPGEIFRLMNETWPESNVFLPTTAPVFKEKNVIVNFENRLFRCKIGKIYDALLLLPVVHYEPLPGE